MQRPHLRPLLRAERGSGRCRRRGRARARGRRSRDGGRARRDAHRSPRRPGLPLRQPPRAPHLRVRRQLRDLTHAQDPAHRRDAPHHRGPHLPGRVRARARLRRTRGGGAALDVRPARVLRGDGPRGDLHGAGRHVPHHSRALRLGRRPGHPAQEPELRPGQRRAARRRHSARTEALNMFMMLAVLLASPPADLKAQGEPGLRAIRAESLSSHIRFLADDLLEGRGTGTRGHALAARYLATQLQALGLEPAGDRGTFFQTVPFLGMTVQPDQCGLELDGAALKYGEEVLFPPRAGSAREDVSGELVFAGYGVAAPEYGYDDAPQDLRGKIAVVLYGAPRSERPDFFPTAASAVYSDGVVKSRLLAKRGAV